MSKFHFTPIHLQDNFGSSAFLFDLRNSTAIIRKISWDKRLTRHIKFMMRLHKKVYKTLYNNCDPNKFAMNDTGDGYLCVFWDKLHALTCLDMAIRIQEFLGKNLPIHNRALQLKDDFIKFDYGIAIHSGGSTINRTKYTKDSNVLKKDFIFGIVVNTVARLESFTKNYIEYKFLVTGNYKDNYLQQATNDNLKRLFDDRSNYVYKSPGRFDIKDGKKNGHVIYTLNQDFVAKFKRYYSSRPRVFKKARRI